MRDYTRFFTYAETADFMVKILNIKSNDVILEPSAGNGSLVKAIRKINEDCFVVAVEIDEQWKSDLRKVSNAVVIKDFLEFTEIQPKYSAVIANPPFGNGVDLQAHFDKMYRMVKSGGKMVIILPDDFDVKVEHQKHPLINWSKNSDGTTTQIKIVELIKE